MRDDQDDRNDGNDRVDLFLNGPYKKAWAAGLAEAAPGEAWTVGVREAVKQGTRLPHLVATPALGRPDRSQNWPIQSLINRPLWPAASAWGRWAVGTALTLALVVGTLPSWYAYTGLPGVPGLGLGQQATVPVGPGPGTGNRNQPPEPGGKSEYAVHPGPPPGYKHPYIAPVDARLSAEGEKLSLIIKNVSNQTLLITPPQSAYFAGASVDLGARVQVPTGWAITRPLALEAGAETVLTTTVTLPAAPGWYEVGLLDRVNFSPVPEPEKQKTITPGTGWILSQRGQAGGTAGGTAGETAGGTAVGAAGGSGRSDGPTGETGEQVHAGAIGPGSIRMFVAPAPGQAVNGELTNVGQSTRDGYTFSVDKVTFTSEYTTVAFTVKGNIPVPTSFGFGLHRGGQTTLEGILALGYKAIAGGMAGTAQFGPTLKGETGLQVVLENLTTYGPTTIPGPWTVEVPVR